MTLPTRYGNGPVRLPPVQPPQPPVDPVTGIGLLGAVLAAGVLGGWAWGGLAACISLVFLNHLRLQAKQQRELRRHQDSLSHMLMQNVNPEDLAKLRAGGEFDEKGLLEFLDALVKSYGGESVKGSGRLPSDEQTEAVAPGITLTLAHDLGWWYAKLVLSGETGRRFLNGEYTQYKGRGRTPQEAIDSVIKRCGNARQQRMIQEYATKLVTED